MSGRPDQGKRRGVGTVREGGDNFTQRQVHTLVYFTDLALPAFLPIFHPQDRSTLTTLGSMAAVRGTRTKMKLLWIAYARASCVAKPFWGGERLAVSLSISGRREYHEQGFEEVNERKKYKDLLAPSLSRLSSASLTPHPAVSASTSSARTASPSPPAAVAPCCLAAFSFSVFR